MERGKRRTCNENNSHNNNEIVLKVYIHCDGCADQILKCLKGFEGVEEVTINSKDHKVMVKGNKADPLKIVERITKKCNKHVELLSPKPKPPNNNANNSNQAEQNEPRVKIVVLKVYMHCENCAQEIKKSIERMKGVQYAEPNLKNSQVTVTGAFDPAKLVEFLYKRAGKHAVIVKEEFKGKEKGRQKGCNNGANQGCGATEDKREIHYHYPPQYSLQHVYPCQIFSDENANSCSIM